MDVCKNIGESIPFVKNLADARKFNAGYVFIGVAIGCLILIQKTLLGPVLSAILALFFPVRDSILLIRSPSPKVADIRRLLVVFIVYIAFHLLECVRIPKIFPFFLVTKLFVVFWVGYDEKHAEAIADLLLSRIPASFLQKGNTIEAAVKKAAKSVDEKISQVKGPLTINQNSE